MALGVKLKPKLSGAARRKIAKQKASALAAAQKTEPNAQYLERGKDGPQEQWSHDRWRLEMRLVYNEMRSHKIPTAEGTSLIWAADVNARVAKIAEELEHFQRLYEQVMETKAREGLPSHDSANGAALIIESQNGEQL